MANLPGGKTGSILEVEFLSKLGQGAFGQVYRARDLKTGQIYAVKAVDIAKMGEGEKGLERVKQEVDLQQAVGQHPNIVEIQRHRYDKKNGIMWIVMEILEGGDLEDVITEHSRHKRPMQEMDIWLYFAQIVQGLRQCHFPETRVQENPDGRVVLHRDLKEANLFLDKERKILKIGDFGLARFLADNEWANSFAGTPEYMAPEMLEDAQVDREYDETVDIHAIGVILFRMCSLRYPFEGRNVEETIKNIRSVIAPKIPNQYSSEMRQLCDALLSRNPKILPSLDRLINHPGVQLGLAVMRLNESDTRIDALASQVTSIEALIFQKDRECEHLRSQVTAMSGNLDKKTSEYKINRSLLFSEIKSLEEQLLSEQQAAVARMTELEMQAAALRLRENECDREHDYITLRRVQLQQDQALLATQQAALTKQANEQRQLHQRLESKVQDLADREQRVAARAEQQASLQLRLTRQAESLAERERKLSAPKERPTIASLAISVAPTSTVVSKADGEGPSQKNEPVAKNTSRVGQTPVDIKPRIGGGVAKVAEPRRPGVPCIKKSQPTVPKASDVSAPSSNVGVSRATENPTARQAIKSGTISTAPAQNPPMNVLKVAEAPRLTSAGTRTGPVKPAQQLVAPVKPVQRGNQVVLNEERKEAVKRKAAPDDSPSASKRKMRSAPAFTRKETVPSSLATTAPTKWSDEALSKKAGRVGIDKSSSVAPSKAMKREPTSATLPRPTANTATNTTNQLPRSQVPISKRMNRGIASRMVSVFA